MKHSALLRAKIAVAFGELGEASRAVAEHPRLPELLPDYFFTLHCIMRASVPMMHDALEESLRRSKTDPVAARLVHYFGEHIPEELGHDDWMAENMAVLGVAREELAGRMPPRAVAMMAGSQMYWMRHFHPLTHLGYIGVVEGYPPDEDAVLELSRRSGYPREAFTSMLRHARLDIAHRDDFDRFVDTLPLRPEQAHWLGMSALHTVGCVTAVLRDVVDSFETTHRAAVPA